MIQTSLVEGKINDVLTVMQHWEVYREISVVTTQSMDQEIKIFLRKVSKLDDILKLLDVQDNRSIIENLEKRLQNIFKSIKKDSSLNAGGKFEWVDSVLIKCLRDGSWLLVDNVNLCSSAVLDRLNGLLEPNGVLTISERGVDSNGKMVEIKPHKDFRLFLTMDPKNGEISRAMRNRGIEIYLLNENEQQANNHYDKTSLVNLEGLPSRYAQTAIKIHDLISETTIFEKPNINELIQLSKLLSQQLKYSSNPKESFINTTKEIYDKTRYDSEVINNIITEDLQECNIGNLDYFNTNLTLKTNEISSIGKIKQQSVFLFKQLEDIKTEDDINIKTCYLILNFYSISSTEDLILRHTYLTHKINLIPDEKVKKLLTIIINYLCRHISKMSINDLPLDQNWITDEINTNCINLNLYISTYNILNKIKLHLKSKGNVTIENGELHFKLPKGNQITLMEYARLVRKKKIEDRFNNIIIQNYANLHDLFQTYMNQVVITIDDITNNDIIEVLYLYFWWCKFFECFTSDVRSKVELSVHYKWFYKFAIRQISTITKVSPTDELEMILLRINSKLDKQFSTIYKLGKNYQKCDNHPPPFTSKEDLDKSRNYNDVYRIYDVTRKGNDTTHIYCNKDLRLSLVELKTTLDVIEFKDNTDKSSLNKFDLQLLPILDIFTHLDLKNTILSNNFINNILLPTDFIGTLLLYQNTKDERLLHEIYKSYYLYLMSSPSVRPARFLDVEDFELSEFGPKLTYLVGGLLEDSRGVVNLGNFRDLSKQMETLGLILWRNLYQLSEERYSFVFAEKQNITTIYQKFLVQLLNSLKINPTIYEFPVELTLKITTKLKEIQNSSTYVDPQQELPPLINDLSKCSQLYTELKDINKFDEAIPRISKIYLTIARLKAKFNSKLSTIDPLAKKTIKRKYCSEAQEMFKIMKTCYENLNRVYSNVKNTRHAYCIPIEDMIGKLEEKHEELSKYVAYRPEDVLYETVCEVVNHAFSTILADNFQPELNETNIKQSLAQQINKVTSFENLIHELSQFRTSYPDIIEPLLSNIAEYLYGFKLTLSHLKLKHKKLTNMHYEIVNELMRFPVLNANRTNYSDHIDLLNSNDVKTLVNHYLEDSEQPYIKNQENFRMLKTAIQESFNTAVINSQLNDNLSTADFGQFNNLVDCFVNAYNKQQELSEKKKEESESLYKMRTKCDDKSEEEQIKEDLQNLFPNYHTVDFADFQQTFDTEVSSEIEPNTKYEEVICYNDLKDVVRLHTVLLKNFTNSEWLNPKSNKSIAPDYILPLMQKFNTFSKILNKIIDSVTYEMDEEVVGSLNVLLAVKKGYGNTDSVGDKTIASKKCNDFYKDSNVEEVKSCYHILEELNVKIKELLSEWPDQPTLKMIIVVIERIYNFEITSPISRFLTGFEILLSKCHEWEEVAHSGISLSQHYQNLTNQIILWRKLELSMWKDLLNRVHDRLNEPLPKWWLYLYNIMHQFLYQKVFNEKELIETLQTFVTKSNLAEYQSRLDLLYAFHCHVANLARTKESAVFVSILWNVYIYFQQFLDNINKRIKDLKSPIEKKLKDYVKIVRWKDINYWAIKETVDKSHKTLHKFMREYQEALEQPVLPCLHNTIGESTRDVGIWDKIQKEEVYYVDESTEDSNYLVNPNIIDKPSKGKLIRNLIKTRDTFKDVMASSSYGSIIKELCNFTTDVIENSNYLQKLEVDTTLPKEKQKSQAKNILQQKHRALADLFKILAKMGLSYKTGLVEGKIRDPTSDFLLEPIDLVANFSHQNYRFEENKIKKIWESSEKYYVRCLMRLDVLATALQNPDKDLGMQNVDRCKGFGLHLLTLIQKQKSDIIETSRIYYNLRVHQNQLESFHNGQEYLPLIIVNKIIDLLIKLTLTVNQYEIILHTCPEEDLLTNVTLDIPVLQSKIEKRITNKNDEMWLKSANFLYKIKTTSSKIILQLNKSKGEVPGVNTSERYVPITDLHKLDTDLQDLAEIIRDVKDIFGYIALTKSLDWLEEEIEDKRRLIQETSNITVNLEYNWKDDVKYLSKRIKTITNRLKKECIEGDEGIKDEHIRKFLIENLSNDITSLEMKDILGKTNNITECILKSLPDEIKKWKLVIEDFLLVLDQIILVYRYYVTQLVSGYRASSKMCSILLNIFIELASKGFCIPPEFSDEFDKEGISKPSDGMGLGEGEGEKDVSDKIESEDQLDDAQPAGQEKEKDDDKDCKEEEKGIEMSEDFESKLQDKEKNEDDSDEDSGDSDAEEQMGDTEKGADQSNKETFGDEKDEQDEDEDAGGAEEKEEKGDTGEKEGEEQLGAKDGQTSKEEENENKEPSNKEKDKKEINEMEEPEYDDDQIDPHHGNQPELPEPEPMDLPDDMQLDDGDQNDDENQNQEENPFDIDTMKTENPPEDKKDETNEDKSKKDDEKEFSSDDEDIQKGEDDDTQKVEDDDTQKGEDDDTQTDDTEDKNKDKSQDSAEPEEDTKSEMGEESGLDQFQSNQDNIEAMEVDDADAADKAQSSKSENKKSKQPIDELHQEDKPDQEGVGQSQMEETSSGHTSQTTAPQEIKSSKDTVEDPKRKQKPGESDSKRSLGDTNQPVRKKLKTVESNKDEDKDDNPDDESAEMYQHIKDAIEDKTQVLDVATKEQAETQHKDLQHDEPKDLPLEDDIPIDDTIDTPSVNPEKTGETKDKKNKTDQHPQGDALEDLQNIQIEGDLIRTETIPRGYETSHHTLYPIIEPATRLNVEEINDLRLDVERQLSGWNDPPSNQEADQAWQKISSVTSALAQDLSEQLRLVLEPTQASRLKGDFRTGRRINMRKVIPYIASQFRKDKIWLRRTKPSKREYQIVLAIDDSSSMADNHSKELAFESVALISKALTLLESGQLSVLSFGEKIEVVHKLTDTFTDKSGIKLLQKFNFDENKTCIAKLVDFATEMFDQSQLQSTALNAKLLVVVSDGRGVFSEGEAYVKEAVRRAKLANIFMVFVIVDNPENKNSVLDIRMPVFKDGKLQEIQSYMDAFPFSFYIILRDINSLPSVLSDALRQWFEIVSNLDK